MLLLSPTPATARLGLLALACVASRISLAADPVQLDPLQISGVQTSEIEAAHEALEQVPGASNLVDMSKVEQGRVAGVADVLAYQPGSMRSRPATKA